MSGRFRKTLCHFGEAAEKRRRDSFERLTRPLIGALNRTAYRMTGDRHVAEDLVQETCLRAYRAFYKFKEGTNYQAWIFRILSNLCTDHLRRSSRAPFVQWNEDEVSGLVAGAGSETDQPDILYLHKTFRDDSLRAMARLAPEVRLVVALALLEDFSYQQIAEVAGCPIGTVRSRLNRGRTLLQQDLRDYMPEEKPLKACRPDRPADGKGRR
ncbi:MAG: sigma-70 family RNA polymerase sigma factor [Methyloligellaceae bacterium]